jgi:hypothetical protein
MLYEHIHHHNTWTLVGHTPLKRKVVRFQYQDWIFVEEDEVERLQQQDCDASNHEK